MNTTHRIQPLSRRRHGARGPGLAVVLSLAAGLVGFTGFTPRSAVASPFKAPLLRPALLARTAPLHAVLDDREDLKAAYNKALGQYNNLELDPALAGLDAALSGKDASDPATAPLRMLRAVIIFSNTGKADKTAAAFVEAVKADYNVSLPTELRSPDLQKLLDKARKDSGVSAPSESFQHTPPATEDVCGKDIVFTALASKVPDGGQLAFYYRPKGEGEFKTSTMDTFGNLASVTVVAADHADKPLEYFFYIFDASNAEQGNKGDQENPLLLDIQCKKDEKPVEKPVEKPKPKSTMPRVFINLGVGTGAGLAKGVADQSYKQYSPFNSGFTYGPAEFACSVARWYAGNTPLPDAAEFTNALANLNGKFAGYDALTLSQAYVPDRCGEHHPVKTGMASAPFHIAPEVGVRVSRALVISGFARLQVVTGSKVFRDDPGLNLETSYNTSVINANPEGVRTKPGFTGAGGIKIKYFLGQDEHKFRLFVGGMVGGGFARLRVPMGFANDRNGNSVPDDQEVATDVDPATGSCLPVWPYGGATCGDAAGTTLATQVATSADKSQRIDTVRIGGGFVGGLFGFNYQVAKNFALFAEISVSVWFPRTSSFLIDLTLGPAITF